MRNVMILAAVCVLAAGSVSMADTFGTGANQFTIDFVTISGATNPTSGIPAGSGFTFTGVSNDYRMGTYEITNAQWNKFKSAYGTVTGTPTTAYDDVPYFTGSSVPTNYVSWYEAAQFVNWLNTSSGKSAAYKFTGTQGTNDYTFGIWTASDAGYNAANPYRNGNAFYFLPTENEWVKAAYWNGSALQAYSNASAGDLISGSPDPAKWNYSPSVGYEPWNATSGVQELNDTHNMMGNVWEWMESPYNSGDYTSGSGRGVRGGSFNFVGSNLSSSNRVGNYPYYEYVHFGEYFGLGFRVASVPEPCSLALIGLGGLALRYRKR